MTGLAIEEYLVSLGCFLTVLWVIIKLHAEALSFQCGSIWLNVNRE